jgi:capsular exopolysaccharide synthesis family protein
LSSISEGTKNASPKSYMVDKPLSIYAEAFRSLLLSVRYAHAGKPAKVVGITSAIPSEGKTITSIGIARIAALQGERVLLVDCDLRRRSLNDALSSEPAVGLLEVLEGSARLDDVIRKDEATGAHLLPLAPGLDAPKNLFGDERFASLLSELRSRYDLVVLDTAPVLPIVDTRVLAPLVDSMVLVARWRHTPVRAIESALKQLSAAGCHLSGLALTQVDVTAQASTGYGDAGYYYDRFKKYYVEY